MMLFEHHAYANRWRSVSPEAKGAFSLCGLGAVFLARTPGVAFGVTLILVLVTLLGPRIPLGSYLRVAAPALGFLALSIPTLVFSLRLEGGPVFHVEPGGLLRAAQVLARSSGGLAALLLLSLSTPMSDLIALLRRLRMPEVMLDIMTLGYRMLFVLSGAVQDTVTAQSARLGYSSPRRAFRSLGSLAAGLMVQVWQRSHDLHQSALSRNNDGPLRFLEAEFPGAGRQLCISALAGCGLMVLARVAA
ncbi:MAG: Cobalt transport protein [Holophagaceae bacterium]|nr:Cobalt transport protein [Holophagaceae bacterium]